MARQDFDFKTDKPFLDVLLLKREFGPAAYTKSGCGLRDLILFTRKQLGHHATPCSSGRRQTL